MAFPQQRILYLNHTGSISGAEKVLTTMLRGLDRTRYEAFALCPKEGDLRHTIEASGVTCRVVPPMEARYTRQPTELMRYLFSFARVVWAVRSEIKRLDPDIVHANTLRAGLAATLATLGSRRIVIWHLHDLVPRHPLTSLIRVLACSSVRTRMIAASNATAEVFCGASFFSRFIRRRMRVIHNGIDLSRFPRKQPGDALLKRELGIPDSSFLICAVGQICARKGLRELVDAFSRIYDLAPQVHLAIVGRTVFAHEAAYRDSLAEMVSRMGLEDRIHLTGERSDVAAVLRSTDLLVLISREEPFGLVLVEAMASGTPVLATRVGGVPEIVTDCESGWLIESGDTAALASKLLDLSDRDDELERAAQVAYETVCPQFSLERFLSNLHAFYAEVAARPDTTWSARMQLSNARFQDEQGEQHV